MKVVIINGSPRANGATGQILTRIKQGLSEIEKDIQIDYYDLGKMDMKYCTGCLSCYKTGQCYIQDDGLEEISKKLAQCDCAIFGSPNYVCNVSAQLKTLIDRGHFVFEQLLRNKACCSVVTYENYGGKKLQKIMKELIRFSGGSVSAEYAEKLNHGESLSNPKLNKAVSKLCRKLIRKMKQKNPLNIFERIMRTFIFKFGLKSHVFKNKKRYNGIIKIWSDKGYIHSDK